MTKEMSVCWFLYFGFQADEEVACELEAEPTAGHTRGDLEKIGRDAFVQTLDTFVLDDDSDGIED